MQMLVRRTHGILLISVLPSLSRRSLSQLERKMKMLVATEGGELDAEFHSADVVEQELLQQTVTK